MLIFMHFLESPWYQVFSIHTHRKCGVVIGQCFVYTAIMP